VTGLLQDGLKVYLAMLKDQGAKVRLKPVISKIAQIAFSLPASYDFDFLCLKSEV
jgi:hypothetical protein